MIRVFKKTICVLLMFLSFNMVLNADETSLKDLKDEYQKMLNNKQALIQKQNEVKNKIKGVEKELQSYYDKIEECNIRIEGARTKIDELNVEIVEKNKEIESLVSFKQVSEGDNVYLEYIFGASTFTDFIYRSAMVEQLTKYNDELISEMYDLIEENKRLQVELEAEIKKSEEATLELSKKLKTYSLTLGDLDEDADSIESQLNTKKKEIDDLASQYKKEGCADSVPISTCIKMPYASGFMRPVTTGSISSNFGLRYHPTYHVWRNHNGIDIAISMGNKVYAAAAGVVYQIDEKKASGGNMVWIKHVVDGSEYVTVYQHLLEIHVKKDQVVSAYTVVGLSGGGGKTLKVNGGWDTSSTGAHLHFGIYKGFKNKTAVDPRNYINFPAKGGGKFYSRV